VENGKYQGDDVDPIADLWIFDPAGILLFSSEGVNRFFSEELNLADWSLQASFLLSPVALHNNGQYFSVKWKFPFSDRWFLFYCFGMNGLIGLSYKMSGGSAVSVGGGMRESNSFCWTRRPINGPSIWSGMRACSMIRTTHLLHRSVLAGSLTIVQS
jgi:hypothetical protein